MENQRLPFVSVKVEKIDTVNIHNHPAPTTEPETPLSKDETLRARVDSRKMERIDAFCAGRKITRSDYIRHHLNLDPEYFDHIELLNDCREQLIPLLKRMSKSE